MKLSIEVALILFKCGNHFENNFSWKIERFLLKFQLKSQTLCTPYALHLTPYTLYSIFGIIYYVVYLETLNL